MGIFNKSTDEIGPRRQEWLRKKNEKARKALEKYGVDLEGCLLFDDTYDDNGHEYLLIFQDRIECIAKGQPGTFSRKGRGTEVIPISRVTSVSTRKGSIFMYVTITASGQNIEFKSNEWMAPRLKEKILELVNAKESAAAPIATRSDPTEQLARLADLHKAGVLTDEEFTSKKTEILKNI